jgi:hypothetical protein
MSAKSMGSTVIETSRLRPRQLKFIQTDLAAQPHSLTRPG